VTKKYNYSLIFLFVFSSLNTFSQSNLNCFSKFQLMKMQIETVENITLFLKNENWNFDGLSQNKKINYNKITFIYDNLIFKNINENVLQIYLCKNKSNFILVKTNFNCFSNFLKSFNFEKRKTSIYKDNISTVFYSNGTLFELLETKGIHIDNVYYILVYNSNYSISNIEKNRLIKQLDNRKIVEVNQIVNSVNSNNLFSQSLNFNPANVLLQGCRGFKPELNGRSVIAYSPSVDFYNEHGKVVFNIIVNNDGVITDNQLVSFDNNIIKEISLKIINKIKFNKDISAPSNQKGKLTFVF
jgi:hypothetical protein